MKQSKTNIKKILQTLKVHYPVVKTRLEHENPFQLLIATILSAQCTDGQVNRVTRNLFAKYSSPQALARAALADIKQVIFSTGFYNNKAKNIQACAAMLAATYQSQVPQDIERLTALPGVGRKTANVVRSVCFGIQTIVVDTHVLRVSNRLGFVETKDPVKAEFLLMEMIEKKDWNDVSLQLIYFGRQFCNAKKPKCGQCPVSSVCPSREKIHGLGSS